jgi:hypothetical protein
MSVAIDIPFFISKHAVNFPAPFFVFTILLNVRPVERMHHATAAR